MKNKKEINVQTTIAQNTESKPTTTQSDFDFVSKMENYDFSTLYAEYMYDKNCQNSKKIYGFDGLDVSLPTFEQALQKFSMEFTPSEKEETIKTFFDGLPKCGLYLFDEACFDMIPDCVKPEFVDIYTKFRRESYKNADKIKFTVSGLLRAMAILLQDADDITDYEKEKLEYLTEIKQNKQLYEKLRLEAFKDFFVQVGPRDFFERSTEKRILYKIAILLDFLLRRSELPEVIEDLTNLRNKARKILNLEPNEYIGF